MAGDGVIPLVHLDSIDEVRAVHKMLFDRKFDSQEDVYFGSPFIASVQHKLVDALAAAEPAKNWAAWRDAAGHPEKVERIRSHLAGLGEWWTVASVIKREAYVRDLLAPLRVDDELLGELIR